MNKTNLKRYAPQARKDFIAAVSGRAQLLGLSEVAGRPQADRRRRLGLWVGDGQRRGADRCKPVVGEI